MSAGSGLTARTLVATLGQAYATMFDELIICLQSCGLAAFLQQPGQLVVAETVPNLPNRNSFWVTFVNNEWYISTWSPTVYRFPNDQNICETCCEIIKSSETAIYRVSETLVKELGLEELSPEEAEHLFDEMDAKWPS